ncbi:hypothetical protein CJ030_MR0G005321 [Morella rubra]|uniref:Uncharacterized protein n=1 Tax=Morella rubra TaxID=262757 RepID=A0A6A1UMJ3_9ROSI|nr:hypothetical protein CJ030_MR0G005321 [Morella rubra]
MGSTDPQTQLGSKTQGTTPPRARTANAVTGGGAGQTPAAKEPIEGETRPEGEQKPPSVSDPPASRVVRGDLGVGGVLPDRDDIEDLEPLKMTKGYVLTRECPAVAKKSSPGKNP